MRLRRLVDNMLELTRQQAHNRNWPMMRTKPAALVRECIESHLPACEDKHLAITARDAAGDTMVLGNSDRLMQVLSNLVVNAIRFTPAGGTIRIDLSVETVPVNAPNAPPMPATNFEAWAPTFLGETDSIRCVRFDVCDSGPGMKAEIRESIFGKFEQGTQSSGGGGGLGLYISRAIVQRHGGTIFVAATEGTGCTVSFRLPAAK